MMRVLILKYSQNRHQIKQFEYISLYYSSTRHLSNESQILRLRESIPLYRHISRNGNEYHGIIKSPYVDLEEFPSDLTIDKYIWENMDQWPNHVAVECAVTGQKYTYSQLNVLTRKFAVSLQKRYKRGTVISIMLPNIPDFVLSVIGLIEAGIIPSSINPNYTAFELSHQLYDCGAVAIITLPKLVNKVREAEELIRTKHKINFNVEIIAVNYKQATTIPEGVTDFKEMISSQVDHNELKPNNRTIDDVAILPYSSGTTGLAKGVQLTHRNCVSNCCQLDTSDTHYFLPTSGSYQDVAPLILPIFHIYGFSVVMTRSLRHGVKLVTLPKFDVPPFLSILKDHRATVLYIAPPIFLFLGSHSLVSKDHLTSLRRIVNGAGPVSQSDGDRILNRYKSNFIICQGYGLTETSPVVSVTSQTENDCVSIGKLIRSTTAKVIKSDGNLAMPGEYGEICVKGPQVMLGYYHNPKATNEVFDDEKYLRTGDVGYYDESGKFYLVDRLKELIKVQGFQVPPAELESLLRSHKAVTDAAVIGIPDAKTGEKPLAFVVTKNEVKVKGSELMDFVSSKVAPYKRLSDVIFVDEIPKSAAGKILRRILRDKYVSSSENKYQ